MATAVDVPGQVDEATVRARRQLLAGLPVTERFIEAGGISTAVLEGGQGSPVVLLRGPSDTAVNWRWIIPDLTTTHRVVAPDLPAHGSTGTGDGDLDEDGVIAWLDDVIDQMCSSSPVLVGHVLGGAIAVRYAVRRGDRLAHLVLNDALGLARFRPSWRFAAALLRFLLRPSERAFEKLVDQCSDDDIGDLRDDLGDDWQLLVDYNAGLARSPKSKAAGRLVRQVGIPRIPEEHLAAIAVPTTLIWGRHDPAVRLPTAKAASEHYGWPLHIIENSADDPAREQPEAFLDVLHSEVDDRPPSSQEETA